MVWVVTIGLSLVACGGAPPPHDALTAAQSGVKGAEVAGATEDPKAQLHLKLASEQIAKAKQLMEDGDNEEAALVVSRAQADADLALAYAQAAKSLKQAKEADEQLGKLKKQLKE
ncbi:MAG TPA: DUF4398 domain-containing protein [Polyangiaceae bacterium]|jgi:hypothetical protein